MPRSPPPLPGPEVTGLGSHARLPRPLLHQVPPLLTTLGALRQVRADYRAAQQRTALGLPDLDDNPEATTLTLAHWTYAGHGHTPGESWLAASIHRDIQHNAKRAAEELPALLDLEGAAA